MSMMNWHIVSTKAEFLAGSPVDTDMYFIADTHEIYRGSESYTQPIRMYTGELPVDAIAVNTLYINSDTLKGDVYNGTSWTTVLKPLADTVTEEGTNPVTGSAVAKYVAAEIAKIGGAGNVVTKITWDEVEQILDVFKGDARESITFNGLAVSLEYNKGTGALQLKDTSGNLIGDAINLDLEKFVTGGEYKPDTKMIILYFDGKTGEESTDKVEIPVSDLVDVYIGENTNTVNTTVSQNKISANVRISVESGNTLVAKDDGLYVSIPDVSGKMNKVSGATDGHILTTDASGQAVDSGIAIGDIHVPVTYTGTTTPEEVAPVGTTAKKGDFCIISKTIGDESTRKVEHTAYICNGSAWVALDGNYSAENVYFPEDLTATFELGNIELENGQATVSAKGKNVVEVWNAIMVKEKNPTINQPSVNVSCPQAKAYEVGTTVNPTFTANLNPGKYEFGPATGITATSWVVKDTASHQQNSNTGSFDGFIVEDDTNYSITATATYEDGAIPKTNTGNDYAAGQIKAGSKSATSNKITGFRAGFYGSLTSKDGAIDSALVRSLPEKTTGAVRKGNKMIIDIPVGALRLAFAYDAALGEVASVTDTNGMGAEVKTAFTLHKVDVEGADGYTTKSYNVYISDLASANDTKNTYTVTI